MLAGSASGCFEAVPDVESSSTSSQSDTSASATGSGSATGTGSSAGASSTTAATTAASCMPSDAVSTVDCGSGQMCTTDTQACCYAFLGVMEPELACGCPDACGPGASEFRCDGPEDCPPNQVCCAVFDGQVSRASCTMANECFAGPAGAITLCQIPADCPPSPGIACIAATMLPDIPNHMTVCWADEYAGCGSPADCPNPDAACLDAGSMGAVCSPPCMADDECPRPTSGEVIDPVCLGGISTPTGKGCAFACDGGKPCPDGMACQPVSVGGSDVLLCVRPS